MPTAIIPNTGDFDTASSLAVPNTDAAGCSWREYLLCAALGDRLILFVNSRNNRIWHYHYRVTGWPTSDAIHIHIPVSLVERQGAAVSPAENVQLFPEIFARSFNDVDIYSHTWLKGLSLAWRGDGTTISSYNVSSWTPQGNGLYRLVLEQTTIRGQDILNSLMVVNPTLVTPASAGEMTWAKLNPHTGVAGTAEIDVFTLDVQGNRLFTVPYELGLADTIDIVGMVDLQLPGARPIEP